MRKVQVLGWGAILMLGISMTSCGGRQAEAPAAEPVAVVQIGRLEERTFPDELKVQGRWRVRAEDLVAAPFAAHLDSLGVRVGDPVHAGQLLGWLQTRESYAAHLGAERMAALAQDVRGRDEAQRAAELARRDAVRVALRSKVEGVVLRRSAEPGGQVAESAEILAIAQQSAMVFEVHVPAEFQSRLRAGLTALVRVPGDPPVSAALERILPSASDGDQSTLAWLKPSLESSRIPRLGREGEAVLTLGPTMRRLAVPDSAVMEDDVTGRTSVVVLGAGDRAFWKTVELGQRSAGWRELRSAPLTVGTRVIVAGQRGLADSSRVRVSP